LTTDAIKIAYAKAIYLKALKDRPTDEQIQLIAVLASSELKTLIAILEEDQKNVQAPMRLSKIQTLLTRARERLKSLTDLAMQTGNVSFRNIDEVINALEGFMINTRKVNRAKRNDVSRDHVEYDLGGWEVSKIELPHDRVKLRFEQQAITGSYYEFETNLLDIRGELAVTLLGAILTDARKYRGNADPLKTKADLAMSSNVVQR